MVGTSNEGILTEYLVRYGALKMSGKSRSGDFLEILYMAERYQAGDDLKVARDTYDASVWRSIDPAEIDRRLIDLGRFMYVIARQRHLQWGLPH
jgi:hypothetical protein